MSYQISYSNGDRPDRAETLDEAREMLVARYGDGVVIHDEWQSAGSGETSLRLVWANEEDADNDAGAKAVAEIIRRIPDRD